MSWYHDALDARPYAGSLVVFADQMFAPDSLNTDEHTCPDCHWPLSVVAGSPRRRRNEMGEVEFVHYTCPTTAERAKLRETYRVNA